MPGLGIMIPKNSEEEIASKFMTFLFGSMRQKLLYNLILRQ